MGACCIRLLKNKFLLFVWLALRKNGPVIIHQYFTSNNINASINNFGGSKNFFSLVNQSHPDFSITWN